MAKNRKTKEGKIIARLRKELQAAQKELRQLKKEKTSKEKQFKSQDTILLPSTSPLYLKRDLTKSLIFSILALAIEFVVYWVFTKGFDISILPAQLKIINF